MEILSSVSFYVIVALIQLLLIASVSGEDSTDAFPNAKATLKTFQVYHSYKSNDFKTRGVIQIFLDEDGSIISSIHDNGKGSIDDSVLEGIDALVSSGGFYRIKVVDEPSGTSVMASASSCEVRRAKFREEIGLTLGSTGSIISISYKSLASPLTPPCHDLEPLMEAKNKEDFAFRSTINFSMAKPGMAIPAVLPQTNPPRGYNWIQRAKKADDNGNGSTGGGSSEDGSSFIPDGQAGVGDQSFLRRYWYIILPVTIMTFLGPEEPAKGAGGGAKSVAAADVLGASSSGRQRRGKRG